MEIDEPIKDERVDSNTNENLSTATLEQCGRWLLSIPRDNVRLLQATDEYKHFIKAFERLGCAHRRQITQLNNIQMEMHDSKSSSNTQISNFPISMCSKKNLADYSFLQHLVVDDVIMRIFEFLECNTLVQLSMTCHRFCNLSIRNAEQRTHNFFGPPPKVIKQHPSCPFTAAAIAAMRNNNNSATMHSRLGGLSIGAVRNVSNSNTSKASRPSHCFFHSRPYLGTVMQLLRAKEQVLGVRANIPPFVSVPLWSLPRRIQVTRAGDSEYNGVYFCTGTNGNGFLFTKPRFRTKHNTPSTLLRCLISKRFSNDSILWYMSKEISTTDEGNNPMSENIMNDLDIHNYNQEKAQVFSFWAELMRSGEASCELCRYPSQTSVLIRNDNQGWQNLEHTANYNPPIVELID